MRADDLGDLTSGRPWRDLGPASQARVVRFLDHTARRLRLDAAYCDDPDGHARAWAYEAAADYLRTTMKDDDHA